jgi:hypothetical protein
MSPWNVVLTCDVDLVDHVTGEHTLAELTEAVPRLVDVLERHAGWRATWFLRMDAQLESMYGAADVVFGRHASLLRALTSRGDELAWHPHCYALVDGQWIPNPAIDGVLDDLARHAPAAQAHGLRTVRMGWAVQTNDTIGLLAREGFDIDSSAVPRPSYPWDRTFSDWSGTPLTPYRPSRVDYRVPGHPAVDIIEIPMSVAPLPAPGDTHRMVRYLNPAFRPELLAAPLAGWFEQHSFAVLITHPMELMPKAAPHAVVAGTMGALDANLSCIERLAGDRCAELRPITLTELVGELNL